jgi:hypothetical protein
MNFRSDAAHGLGASANKMFGQRNDDDYTHERDNHNEGGRASVADSCVLLRSQ